MDTPPCTSAPATRASNPLVYWLVRAVLQPFFHLYFRLSRIGREHIPEPGRSSSRPTTGPSSTRS